MKELKKEHFADINPESRPSRFPE